MSYQDTLDKRASIKVARQELEHFAELLKLHQSDPFPSISSAISSIECMNKVMQFINYDQKQVNLISKKDAQLEFINHILVAISRLDEEEMQLIYAKYVLMNSNEQIEKNLLLSESKRKRILRNALFDMSIILKIEVIKKQDKE